MNGKGSKSLGELVTVVGGGTPTRSVAKFYGGGIPWVTPKDMKCWDIRSAQVHITEAGLENSATRLVPANSVLVVVRSGVLKHTLPVAVTRVPVAINQDMKALLCSDDIDADFLARFIKAQSPVILQWVRATTADNIPIDKLKRLPVPVPPLPEQRRIAAILDKADALRAKRRAALAQLDTLTQSIFLDMFGDPATNPMGWPATTLGDALIAIRNGTNAEQREEPGGWPITRIETISDGTINPERVRWIEPDESLIENFQLEPGDILFSHINSVEHIGKTALYSGTPTLLIHGINLLRLRPNVEFVDPVWLLHLLKHDFVRTHFRTRCKRAVNQASLNQSDIKSVRTFLPPLSLQYTFARRVAALQSLECAYRASLGAQDSLFASLQHRAFRGEL